MSKTAHFLYEPLLLIFGRFHAVSMWSEVDFISVSGFHWKKLEIDIEKWKCLALFGKQSLGLIQIIVHLFKLFGVLLI